MRLLPARVVVYYVLALALFADAAYEEVMRQLVEGLSWESGWEREWKVPSEGAIYKARERLGREPLELLFRAVTVPLAGESTRGAFYRGWRLMSLDGTAWTWRTRRSTMRSLVARARIAGKAVARSRSCGWWRWRSAGRMRSATSRWDRIDL